MCPRSDQKGFSMAEVLAAVFIMGVVLAAAAPAFTTYRRHAAVRTAARELRSVFGLSRSRAVARGVNSGVKFFAANGEWSYATYDDGNHNGVRSDEIAKGIDRRISGPTRLIAHGIARIGLPPEPLKNPDGDLLKPGSSPVVFNQSTLCSFSVDGSGTPGSIYLTDDAGELYVVRVFGATGKVRTLRYNRGSKKWEGR
jgi:prepilin-type N-terminal cleavage/methylation domain-containing protein